MSDINTRIRNIGVVPVIKIDSVEQAKPLAQALITGGMPVAEVTFRTAAAEESIRTIHREFPDMLVGAGTITNVATANRAIDAGAQFIVSPGYSDEVVAFCQEKQIPIFPGVNNASQIQQALERGLKVVKFFPAEASGGVAMLEALAGPFPALQFMPTGGIGMANLASYIKQPNVIACGGSWMVKADLINQGKWDEISRLCREAVAAVQGFTFAHLGVSADTPEECRATTQAFGSVLQPVTEGNSSCFASSAIEITKSTSRGKHGHIAIGTFDIERALAYLESFGYQGVPETIKRDAKGMMTMIYLDKEIGGFALHLLRSK